MFMLLAGGAALLLDQAASPACVFGTPVCCYNMQSLNICQKVSYSSPLLYNLRWFLSLACICIQHG